ncbi:macrolide family glycosyltransferase [Pseudonocardia xinjiangensis]|uniref:macrolide family glycosyltransferase n=1 Tax=Pseudonocardia xinjiangensis TaxID=75289 RepID=UPI003D92F20C
MSRFLFLPVPGHGHINPTLAVAAELGRRGHQVTYVVTEEFGEQVVSTGAELVAYSNRPFVPPGAVEAQMAPLMCLLMGIAEDVAEPLLGVYDRLRPDVVVGEMWAPWSAFLVAARSANSVCLAPSYVPGPDSSLVRELRPPVGPDGRILGLERLPAIAELYGLRPEQAAAVLFRYARRTVVFMPAEFHPEPITPHTVPHFVGPALSRDESTEGFDLSFIADTPAVYVSLGTVYNSLTSFYAACIEAFGGGPRPAVLSHGARITPADLPAAPANVLLAPRVPQLHVLERSAAFVTHGGMGSTMESIMYGVPMVVVPQMIEQAVTADRVAELGLGVRLDPAAVTVTTLAAAVTTVTEDPSYREACARMSAAARSAGGAQAAADVLEAAAP